MSDPIGRRSVLARIAVSGWIVTEIATARAGDRPIEQGFAPTGVSDGLSHWETWLRSVEGRSPLVVHVSGRATPGPGQDPRWRPIIELFERYGVDQVIERSDRGRFETPPIRVGQVDPAGIRYRADEANAAS
jgi:hypothetical protein